MDAPQMSVTIRILTSHFLAKWAFQMWDFVVPLMLFFLFPSSFMPSATILFVRVYYLDPSSETGSTTSKGYTNLSVLITGYLVAWLFVLRGEHPDAYTGVWDSWRTGLVFGCMMVSCMMGDLASMTLDIAVERDWVPVCISVSSLTSVNSWMARLDLVCETCAPILIGVLIDYLSHNAYLSNRNTFLIVALWNWLTSPVEYLLLRSIWRMQPALATAGRTVRGSEEFTGGANPFLTVWNTWKIFTKQTVAVVIVANACLWLNVLSPHDPLMTQFLLEWRLPVLAISLFRALGAVFGVLSTFAFPLVLRWLSLVPASASFIILEGVTMLATVAVYLIGRAEGGWFKYAFMGVIVISRIGLYGFCIGYVQHLQTGIEETTRGKVNSIDKAFTKLALLLISAAGIVFSTPAKFQWMIYISAGAINIGAVLYVVWALVPSNRNFINARQETLDGSAETAKLTS